MNILKFHRLSFLRFKFDAKSDARASRSKLPNARAFWKSNRPSEGGQRLHMDLDLGTVFGPLNMGFINVSEDFPKGRLLGPFLRTRPKKSTGLSLSRNSFPPTNSVLVRHRHPNPTLTIRLTEDGNMTGNGRAGPCTIPNRLVPKETAFLSRNRALKR